jgi:basic amino acid/polyamine antiporter, APA family
MEPPGTNDPPQPAAAQPPSRLARRLTTFDAVVIGLGAMIGAGVFTAIGPAARAAGTALLVGLVIAAFVAYCNATSSAQLAAVYPESGGAYVYGRKRLGALWGFIAGWGFVVGKLASCAAMALTFGVHVAPSAARPIAIGAVAALTAINYFGIQKTAQLTRVIVALVVIALAITVGAALGGGGTDPGRLWPLTAAGPYGVLQAGGFLFFAFAGYARIATLGEEVVDPARTIPRAIPIALAITLVVYAVVAVAALLVADVEVLARSPAPLVAAVEAGGHAWLAPVVRIGAAIASLGVLLSLIVGVARTTFAMAANHELPAALAAVHPRYRVPHRAELAVAAIVIAVVAVADVRAAIGFSSFAVLVYYAVANAAAFTLPAAERRWPRALAVAGLAGCITLAVSLPIASVAAGAGVLLVGCVVFAVLHRRHARPEPR